MISILAIGAPGYSVSGGIAVSDGEWGAVTRSSAVFAHGETTNATTLKRVRLIVDVPTGMPPSAVERRP